MTRTSTRALLFCCLAIVATAACGTSFLSQPAGMEDDQGEDTGGVHARFAWSESRGLRVIEVPEGPAKRAGIRRDDIITSINGESIIGIPERRAIELLRGPIGSEVRFMVTTSASDSGPATSREVTVERTGYRRTN